jgi:uncharacterized protein
MAKPLVVNAVELLRRPGSTKDIEVVVVAEDFEFNDSRIDDVPVQVRLHLEALSDGIAVTGVATAHWHGECKRCLAPVQESTEIDIDELYQVKVTDPDAFPIDADQLTLLPMVRENILVVVPQFLLCQPECKGMCPQCGADLNEGQCSCATPVTDDRWAALEALKRELADENEGTAGASPDDSGR